MKKKKVKYYVVPETENYFPKVAFLDNCGRECSFCINESFDHQKGSFQKLAEIIVAALNGAK